jgi:hypothetical protein
MINNVLKWSATLVLIIGTAVNNLGYQPAGPLLLLAGGSIWLVVSIRWKEPALIATNLVMTLTGAGALLYKLTQG